MRKAYRLTVLLVTIIVAAAWVIPAAADNTNAKQGINRIIDYNLAQTSSESVQTWIDGDLTQNAGIGAEWYVLALCNYGDFDFSRYKYALKNYLDTNEISSATSRQKYALVLVALGNKNDSYINQTVENSIGEQGIMSLIFGLHLLNNGCENKHWMSDDLIDEILNLQLADGGWAITGDYGDVDVTAMAIQALAVHYSSDSLINSAVNNALDYLSARQLENGAYSSYGSVNPESTAQVIIALSSLGIDAVSDIRFIKNGNTAFDGLDMFLLPDGSYCHKTGGYSNSTATVQTFCAFVAYSNLKNGKNTFYMFNEKAPAIQEAETTAITEPPEPLQTETTSAPLLINGITDVSESHSSTHSKAETTDPVIGVKENNFGYKPWIAGAVAVVCAVICVFLWLSKKRSIKDFLAVLCIAVAGICFVLLVDFETPENHYANITADKSTIGTVTISIRCDTVKEENSKFVPKNGIILEKTEIAIDADDTVYDILYEACSRNKIHMEVDASLYVEGINNIYEKDYGDLSGWMYFVNGSSPSVGCGEYKVSNGEYIEWHYTRELGKDLSNTANY